MSPGDASSARPPISRQPTGLGQTQKADERLVVAADDGVLDGRRRGGDQVGPQHAGMHPGSRVQLEVLGDPAVEQQPLGRVVRVLEPHAVTELEKAILVERRFGEIGAAEIARGDGRALAADLHFLGHRRELDLHPRGRHAHIAGAVDDPVGRGNHRRGFGRTKGRRHDDPFADRVQCQFLQALPQILRQRRGRVEDEAQILEEGLAQLPVLLEIRHQHAVADGHVVMGGR